MLLFSSKELILIKFNQRKTLLNNDEVYILRCLELAQKGLGMTRQNPMVGAVIVCDNRIIAEGYHNRFGGPHAEVNAINSVKDKTVLTRSTLYVNLEPCSHHGKTPPCSLLIRDVKIPRIVIGSIDPNPLIYGRGIALLKESGAEVITGIKEKECRFLNRRFYTFHEKKRPYIILKWAQSMDGFLDTLREKGEILHPNWISNQTSRLLVHKWRSEEIAVMVGTNTILTDNPELNVRNWPGLSPVRVVPDKSGKLFDNLKIFNGKNKTIVFRSTYKSNRENVEYVTLSEDRYDPPSFLEELYRRNILSVLVEGGANLLNSFIGSGLWDEARIFTGNIKCKNGIKAPVLNGGVPEQFTLRDDLFEVYFNEGN